jgi:hypothetical protein
VKFGGFPAAAIERVGTDGTVAVMLDVFQTLVSVAFTLGRPTEKDEKLPPAAALLRGTTLKNVSLALKPNREIVLPAAAGQPPTTIRIGSGAEISLQFLTLDGSASGGQERVQTSGGLISWLAPTLEQPMRFAGNGRARLVLKDIRAVNADGSEASFASIQSDLPFSLTGGGDEHTKFAFTRIADAGQSLALAGLELRMAGKNPARAGIEALEAEVKGSEFILDRATGRMRTWDATLSSVMSGKFGWAQSKIDVTGTLAGRPIVLTGNPAGFAVDLPEGVAVLETTLKFKGNGDQTEVALPLIAFGPTSHSQTQTASLSSIGALDLQFNRVTVRGQSGRLEFESQPAGRFTTNAPLVLSAAGVSIPDFDFKIPQGRGTIATNDRGSFTFGPLVLGIEARDVTTAPAVKFQGALAAQGRFPIESVGLANLRLSVGSVAGNYAVGTLDWSIDDARLGLMWADLFDQLKAKGVHQELAAKPLKNEFTIWPVKIYGLKAGRFSASKLDLKLEGDARHPELRFDAHYNIAYPIAYKVWNAGVRWEMKKIGFIKTKVPVPFAGWEVKGGSITAKGDIRLRDVAFDVHPQPLLGQCSLELKGRFGGSIWPGLSGCDWRLEAMVATAAIFAAPILVPVLAAANFTDWTLPFKHSVELDKLQEPWASTNVKAMGFTEWNSQVIEFRFSGSGRSILSRPLPGLGLEKTGGDQ